MWARLARKETAVPLLFVSLQQSRSIACTEVMVFGSTLDKEGELDANVDGIPLNILQSCLKSESNGTDKSSSRFDTDCGSTVNLDLLAALVIFDHVFCSTLCTALSFFVSSI